MAKKISDFFHQLSGGSNLLENLWAFGTVQHIFFIVNSEGYLNFIGQLGIVGIGLGLVAAATAFYSLIAVLYFPFWLFGNKDQ